MNEFFEKQPVKPLAVYVYGHYAEKRHVDDLCRGCAFRKNGYFCGKKSGPYQKFAVKFMRIAFTLYRKCVIIILKFKLTRIARYRKDGNLYEINICNRK